MGELEAAAAALEVLATSSGKDIDRGKNNDDCIIILLLYYNNFTITLLFTFPISR